MRDDRDIKDIKKRWRCQISCLWCPCRPLCPCCLQAPGPCSTLPILAQELGAISHLDPLGEGLSEAPHLREHLSLVRHRMAPPEFFRLRKDPPSPLLARFFLTRIGHLV